MGTAPIFFLAICVLHRTGCTQAQDQLLREKDGSGRIHSEASRARRERTWRFAELGVRASYFGGGADWFSLVGGTIPFSRR
jgi:hypothetical protein